MLTGAALLLGGSAALAQAADELEIDWFAYVQLTAEHLGGDHGTSFGSDRVRFGSTATYRRLSGAVQIDFGAGDLGEREPGMLANVIKDLYAGYTLGAGSGVQLGQFKTPLGMDFNGASDALDITKRGMEAGLVLDRGVGVMVSGRGLGGGFGYDAGYFNVAGRSAATSHIHSQQGDDNALAMRGLYDAGRWHAELAYGESARAGGPGTADYRVTDLGIRYTGRRFTAKGEWIEGRGVRGDPDRTERVHYLHGAYAVGDEFELVARHYAGKSRIGTRSTDLSNTYLGFTWHPLVAERLRARLQFNYVIAGGDREQYTGVSGFRDDAVLVQVQIHVRK